MDSSSQILHHTYDQFRELVNLANAQLHLFLQQIQLYIPKQLKT